MQIIDGRKTSEEILSRIKNEVMKLDFVPVFCDILVGEDIASIQYVNLKKRKAQKLGIDFYDANFPNSITTSELLLEIEKINKIKNMAGIIVQLPLPIHLDTKKILDAIDPSLDVDCLGEVASNNFYNGIFDIVPPTGLSCIYLLESLNIDLQDKNIVVVGSGKLVGRPVANILKSKNLNFQIINSESLEKEKIIKNADIIISGVGKGGFINAPMVKDNVIIIDAGTSEEEGSVVGDVDFESVSSKVYAITPVPGGVGPVTVAMLFSNILEVTKRKINK